MIKKVETCWVGVHEGKNHGFRFFLLLCSSASSNTTKHAKKVCWSVLQHPTEFQAKILTGKFYL